MEFDSVCNHTSDYKIAGVRFVNHEYDYRLTSDGAKSTYQLIIEITICEYLKVSNNSFTAMFLCSN